MMRTPNATEHRSSIDNDFQPVQLGEADQGEFVDPAEFGAGDEIRTHDFNLGNAVAHSI